jgi:sulfur carrier protein ThiS adenylyltransferase
MLSPQEQLRYSRHLLLNNVGEQGQLKLKNASVLIVGLGGLGNPVSLYLAAAGVGKLFLADGDKLDITNLQRQVMFTTEQVGENKAELAAAHLTALNPEIDIEVFDEMLDSEQLSYYLDEVDLVVDCTDNLATRKMINKACWQQQTPLVTGAAIRSEGQLMVVDPRQQDSACYQCLLGEDAQEQQLNCQTAGVLGPVLGIIGSMQALEAIKLILGKEVVTNKLKLFDAMSLSWQEFKLPKRADCSVCNN